MHAPMITKSTPENSPPRDSINMDDKARYSRQGEEEYFVHLLFSYRKTRDR